MFVDLKTVLLWRAYRPRPRAMGDGDVETFDMHTKVAVRFRKYRIRLNPG
jgi:hypothetical protein